MELTLETIRAAHARIAPYIVQTPLLRLPALDDALGCEVYAKAECMQRTGAVSGMTMQACVPKRCAA